MRHLGILRVTRELSRQMEIGVTDWLPPGHAIIATRDCPDWFWVDYLIEGPDMPGADLDGELPPTLRLIFRKEATDGRVTGIFAHWDHKPESEWPIPLPAPRA